jgi:hypothetical protein
MGDGGRITYSRAKKCFVCGRTLEDAKHVKDDGTVVLCVSHEMGVVGKYERLCWDCSEQENEKAKKRREEHLLESGVKQ